MLPCVFAVVVADCFFDLNSVVIKGTAGAEAVLCSATRTYALKIVETTNSLLLVPPVQVGVG